VIPTEWIVAVHWNDSAVQVDVGTDAVRNAPEYDPAAALDGDDESRLHDHFRRPRYPPAA
jgi:hypothetical protein